MENDDRNRKIFRSLPPVVRKVLMEDIEEQMIEVMIPKYRAQLEPILAQRLSPQSSTFQRIMQSAENTWKERIKSKIAWYEASATYMGFNVVRENLVKTLQEQMIDILTEAHEDVVGQQGFGGNGNEVLGEGNQAGDEDQAGDGDQAAGPNVGP